jgi:hypothetical protein
VPDVTNFYSDQMSDPNWASRLGVSIPLSTCGLGTSVPAAEPFAIPVDALPRVRGRVAVLVPQAQKVQAQKVAVGQTNIHNYMTGATAVGEGASGPPRDRGPV